MKFEDYEQYHQKGGTYIMPVEVFNELFDEMECWREETKRLIDINKEHQEINGKLREENKQLKERIVNARNLFYEKCRISQNEIYEFNETDYEELEKILKGDK